METPFPPFDPEGAERGARLRDIPLRTIFPNLLTLLAIASGLTAIRFAIEGRLELAVGAIILAAFLDGIDGRVARFLKSTTRFGEQMDSLADFVNFGVAPAMILYFALLRRSALGGWLVAMLFAICGCLRLARFNVTLDMPGRPAWQNNFFTGVPAPAGALAGLAPIYALLLGSEETQAFAVASAIYTLAIALLMVSSLPTFSGKEMSRRVPRNWVLPLLILVVADRSACCSAILGKCCWPFSALYLASLPFGYAHGTPQGQALRRRQPIRPKATTTRPLRRGQGCSIAIFSPRRSRSCRCPAPAPARHGRSSWARTVPSSRISGSHRQSLSREALPRPSSPAPRARPCACPAPRRRHGLSSGHR